MPIAGSGQLPDVAVDREGTADVVWNEHPSSGPDVLHYCQIPLEHVSCENRKEFTPPEGSTNLDFNGPHVLIGALGKVILFTHRCCAKGQPGLEQNWVYVSEDGGQSFGEAQQGIGNLAIGVGEVMYEAAGNQLMEAGVSGGVGAFQAQPLGTDTSEQATLYPSHDTEGATLAPLGQTSWIYAADQLPEKAGEESSIHYRTFSCSGCEVADPASGVNNAANWSPDQVIGPGKNARLASGPTGTFLFYTDPLGSQAFVRKWNGAGFDAPVALAGSGSCSTRRSSRTRTGSCEWSGRTD